MEAALGRPPPTGWLSGREPWITATLANYTLRVGPDGLDYQTIVIAAYDGKGHSLFATADPGGWWCAEQDEVIC